MILKVGDDVLKVVESSYHVGQGKMPGSVHAKLRHVRKGAFKELRWRPEEKLEDTSLEKQEMEFLYSDADSATFMDPTTFDQVSIPLEAIGPATRFLKPEMKVPVEFYQGEPVSIIFPEIVEVKVETNPSRTTCLCFADRSASSSAMLDCRTAGVVAVKPSPYASKASRSGEFTSPLGRIKPPLHRTDPLRQGLTTSRSCGKL